MDENKKANDVLMPEGWNGTGDFFDESTWNGEPTAENEETETPTTETEVEVKPAEIKDKLKFKARYNHEDLDVEMDESELPTIYQKSLHADTLNERLTKANAIVDKAENTALEMGFENAEQMFEQALQNYRNSEIERLVAKNWDRSDAEEFVNSRSEQRISRGGRKEKPAEVKTEIEPEKPKEEKAPERNFQIEVAELLAARPSLRGQQIPQSVNEAAVVGGKRLLHAYLEYENQLKEERITQLEADNTKLRNSAATAARAPVTGVSGGGETDTKPEDPFLAGWNYKRR